MVEDYMWNHNWVDQLLLSTLPLLELSRSIIFKVKINGVDIDRTQHIIFSGINKRGDEIQYKCMIEEMEQDILQDESKGIMQYIRPMAETFSQRSYIISNRHWFDRT
ncbi:hypothetical protein FEZ51_08510 [Pediococcus stilesii]|uniref:Uncharacterized protein n=1 Tax=Pediococcus stilesii TaxID=331679 RepID=A0A5R9BSP5_9LACO|nr:hypothetical protein [Pediococcus stilesii]TLQ03637.1 hypothetical protein FEZ51_08510 [Pediococcus stilesii]